VDAARHRRALKRLKRLRLNDLVVVEYEDNCILSNIITRKEAFESEPETLKTTGFYQGHTRNYLFLALFKFRFSLSNPSQNLFCSGMGS